MKLKRSSVAIRIVIAALIVYAAVKLVSLQTQIRERRAEAAALAGQIVSAEQETQRLQNAIKTVNTDEGTEEIARAKLGLAIPGEIIFHDVGK